MEMYRRGTRSACGWCQSGALRVGFAVTYWKMKKVKLFHQYFIIIWTSYLLTMALLSWLLMETIFFLLIHPLEMFGIQISASMSWLNMLKQVSGSSVWTCYHTCLDSKQHTAKLVQVGHWVDKTQNCTCVDNYAATHIQTWLIRSKGYLFRDVHMPVLTPRHANTHVYNSERAFSSH